MAGTQCGGQGGFFIISGMAQFLFFLLKKCSLNTIWAVIGHV
jgi:hypothetical protein